MTKEPVVGFIGLGPMGRGMARNLVRKGVRLMVLGHKRREPVEELVALGALEVESIKALGSACDVVFLCLPSSREVEAVTLAEDGLANAMRPGSFLLDSTTAEPSSTLRIAQILSGRGIRFLDAPLTRTSKDADAGRLNVLVGGAAEDLEAVRPLIQHFSENIFYIGPIGSAHKVKLINNFLTIGCTTVVLEAIAAAQSLDVDTKVLFNVVSQGGANSGAFQMIMPWVNDGEMKFLFSVGNARKDVGYYNASASPGLVARAVEEVLNQAVRDGRANDWIPELAMAKKR